MKGSKKMKCPHCGKLGNNENYKSAIMNTENYGSSAFSFECIYCNKKFSAYFRRTVIVDEIEKASKNADVSFGFDN